jgi:uncharacterized protein (DUF2147 family)
MYNIVAAGRGIRVWRGIARPALAKVASAAVLTRWLAAALALLTGPALADDLGPVGRWGTIDSKTHAVGSIVEITSSNEMLQGKIVKLVQLPGQDPSAMATTCTQCTGALKGQPINGLLVLWNLKRDGDEWTGGTILDTSSGSTYSAKLRLTDGGQKMLVRAYLGVSWIGTDLTWVRMK